MSQSDTVKRIKEICDEFDSRVDSVGLALARLELAKALAENESAQKSKLNRSCDYPGCTNSGVIWVCTDHSVSSDTK